MIELAYDYGENRFSLCFDENIFSRARLDEVVVECGRQRQASYRVRIAENPEPKT